MEATSLAARLGSAIVDVEVRSGIGYIPGTPPPSTAVLAACSIIVIVDHFLSPLSWNASTFPSVPMAMPRSDDSGCAHDIQP